MKVLIIGGTGVISTDVTSCAIENGIDVYLLNRGKRREFIHPKAHLIASNIRNVRDVAEKTKDLYFDVVIDFLSLNLSQMKTTLKAIKTKYNHYIFISSATVYDNRVIGDKEITEEMPVGNKKWRYVIDKLECEKYLKDESLKKNINYTIVRPYITYNKTRIPFALIPEGYYQWTLINRILLEKPIVLWDDGNAISSFLTSKDFAKRLIPLFNNSKAYSETFHITNNEIITWKESINIVAEILDKKISLINIPSKFIIKRFPELKGAILDDKRMSYVFDNSKIKEISNAFDDLVSYRNGIKETISFYLNNKKYQKVDFAWEARMDSLIQDYCNETLIRLDKEKVSIKYYVSMSLKEYFIYIINRYKLTYYFVRNVKVFLFYANKEMRSIIKKMLAR